METDLVVPHNRVLLEDLDLELVYVYIWATLQAHTIFSYCSSLHSFPNVSDKTVPCTDL